MEKKAGAGPNFGCEVIVVQLKARDLCTASATSSITRCKTRCKTRKRKIAFAGVDAVNKENLNIFLNGTPAATKRICQEKTGTDWQTVLDVIAYGEEQNRWRNQDTTVTMEEK